MKLRRLFRSGNLWRSSKSPPTHDFLNHVLLCWFGFAGFARFSDSAALLLMKILETATTISTKTSTNKHQTTMTRKVIQQPNRLTGIFAKMKETCPQHIRTYAQCVIIHQNEGTLDHKTCQLEFDSVKQCFRSVRFQKRWARRKQGKLGERAVARV